MSREEKLLEFYYDIVKKSHKDILSSVIFYEEAVFASLFGHDMHETDFSSISMYEMLLISNLCINPFDTSNDKCNLKPFSAIDKNYYEHILYMFVTNPLHYQKWQMIMDMTKSLEMEENTLGILLLKKIKPEFINTFEYLKRLKNVLRKGWINRNVQKEYWENDASHIMQMIVFVSAYFRIYKPDMDEQRIMEMILFHEMGESVYDDYMDDGSKNCYNAHLEEKRALDFVFKNLESEEYFRNLWLEFEEKRTKEGKFVYMIDKLDAVLKSKFIEKETNHKGLFADFCSYEEKRNTFSSSKELTRIFELVKC